MKQMYKGFEIVRIDNFTYQVNAPQGQEPFYCQFTRIEYAKESIDARCRFTGFGRTA